MSAADPSQASLLSQENAFLRHVQAWLRAEMLRLENEISALSEESIALKSSAWDEHLEEKSGAGAADNANVQGALRSKFILASKKTERLQEYRRILNNPFFGRIRFQFEGDSEPEDYYIGLLSLYDSEATEELVIDWRSPLASLFYDHPLGPAHFAGPHGEIYGTLLEKARLRIENGQVTAIHPLDDEEADEDLKEILSQPASAHLHEIAASIQAAQNRIIRFAPHASLLVLGAAGSGKSSIALHRAAWLLYRQQLDSRDILFLSPNPLFEAYIADILPSLGESQLNLYTVEAMERAIVSEAAGRFSDYHFSEASPRRLQAAADGHRLEKALAPLLRELEKAELEDAVAADEAARRQAARSLAEAERDAIDAELRAADEAELSEWGDAADSAEKEGFQGSGWNDADSESSLLRSYQQWLASGAVHRLLPELYESDFNRPYDRLDLAILARLAVARRQSPYLPRIRCFFLDEAQDLLPIEHATFAANFRVPADLFGDSSQAIRFDLPADYWEQVRTAYRIDSDEAVVSLRYAYRSTWEIMDFARRYIDDPQMLPFARHGEPVRSLPLAADSAAQHAQLASVLQAMISRGRRRLALLFADSPARQNFLQTLSLEAQPGDAVRLSGPVLRWLLAQEKTDSKSERKLPTEQALEARDTAGREQAVSGQEQRSQAAPGPASYAGPDLSAVSLDLLPLRLAKGLEYDGVVLWDVPGSNSLSLMQKKLLYVGSTRALHELVLFARIKQPGPAGSVCQSTALGRGSRDIARRNITQY